MRYDSGIKKTFKCTLSPGMGRRRKGETEGDGEGGKGGKGGNIHSYTLLHLS